MDGSVTLVDKAIIEPIPDRSATPTDDKAMSKPSGTVKKHRQQTNPTEGNRKTDSTPGTANNVGVSD